MERIYTRGNKTGYNTLKQRRFKQAIRKGAKTKTEAARIAGYSPRSRTIFEPRRQTKTNLLISEALNIKGAREEDIVNDFILAKQLTIKKDMTNFNRANEDLARCRGLFKDKPSLPDNNDVPILTQYVIILKQDTKPDITPTTTIDK